MNIIERAKQLAAIGRSNEQIIRTLKAERYEDVHAYLSPSVRRELRDIREAAKQAAG